MFARRLALAWIVAWSAGAGSAWAGDGAASRNDAYPPEIARWTEDDLAAQRQRTEAMMRDLRAALAAKAKRFVVPPGDYRFDNQPTKNLHLQDLSDFEIDATGATFWVDGRQRIDLVFMRRCRDVAIKGLTVDYYPLAYTQGRIARIDAGAKTLDVALDPGFPEPVLPLWLERPGQIKAIFFDAESTRMIQTRLDWVARLDPVGERVYRVAFQNHAPFTDAGLVKAGDGMVMPYRGYRMVSNLVDCANIRFEDVTVYGTGQMAFTEEGGDGGNVYLRCKTLRRPGTKRLLVCPADTFHSAKTVKGPTIEDCEFGWGGDDFVNIHGNHSVVHEQPSPREIVVATIIAPESFEGREVKFYAFGSLAPRGAAKVEKATPVTDKAVRDAMANMPAEMNQTGIRSSGFYGRDFYAYRLTLDRPVELDRFTLVENAGNSGSGARIVNSYFHDGFTRGVLCRGDGAVIEGNRIERVVMSGLYLGSENYFMEAAGPANITVRNNDLRDVSVGMQARRYHLESGAILVYAADKDWHGAAGSYPGVNVTIENNRITNSGTFGVFLSNVDGGRIVGNTIDGAFHLPLSPEARKEIRDNASAIYVNIARNVEVADNRIVNSGADVKRAVIYGPDVVPPPSR